MIEKSIKVIALLGVLALVWILSGLSVVYGADGHVVYGLILEVPACNMEKFAFLGAPAQIEDVVLMYMREQFTAMEFLQAMEDLEFPYMENLGTFVTCIEHAKSLPVDKGI